MEMRGGSLLANLLTVGNGICGFTAVVKLSQVEPLADGSGFENPENFTVAAALILLGMVFDVFDGKVARLSRGGTELGEQLDSFCDLITFGLVPAFMIVQLNIVGPERWQSVVWFFSLAYFLGAMLRLARFNIENSPDENAHLSFKGLPSPGAAGCVASLVLFQRYVLKFEATELVWLAKALDGTFDGAFDEGALKTVARQITFGLPFVALFLGFSMVSSRLEFEHFGSKLFARGYSFDFLASTILILVLLAIVPELVLPLAFCGYLVWTPLVMLWRKLTGRRSVRSELATPGPGVSDEDDSKVDGHRAGR